MSGTFGKIVLPSLFVSGAVFAALAVPLAVYGSEKVDVQVSESIGISGATVQDFTVPYLGLSGLASFAFGSATATMIGVGASKKQAKALEQQYLDAQINVQNRERQLQDALLSEPGLTSSGLSFFLDEQVSAIQTVHPEVTIAAHAQDLNTQVSPSFAQAIVPVSIASHPPNVVATPSIAQGFIVMNSSNLAVQPVKVPRATAQAATSPMNAAHGFLGFARLGQPVAPAAIAWAEETAERQSATQQLDILQNQLQGLMIQIEQIQVSLKTQSVAEPTSGVEMIQGDRSSVAATSQRFQPFEYPWTSAPQGVAS